MNASATLVLLLVFPAVLVGCLGDDGPTDAPPGEPGAPSEPPARERFGPGAGSAGSSLQEGNGSANEAGATVHILETGYEAGEPTIAFSSDGTPFIVAGLETIRSTDGGQRWQTVYEALTTSDPMLAVDPVTDRVFTLHMLGTQCANLAWSDDGGQTWTDRPMACTVPVIDFLKMAAGPPGPEPNPQAGVTYPSVLYICKNTNSFAVAAGRLSSSCSMSYDGGLTWPVERVVAERGAFTPAGQPPAPTNTPCGGVTGFPAVGPDGTVVVPLGNGCPTFYMAVSRDSGLTWSVASVPGQLGLLSATPEASFAPDGTLYVLWRGSDNAMYLARTPDLGQTWAGPWNVSAPGVRTTGFQALEAGGDGRVALAYLGSRDTGAYMTEVEEDARWDLYIVTSDDADTDAPVFASLRVNDETDPIQVGRICFGGSGCERNLGDFFTAAASAEGVFHVAYTDGCGAGCAGSPDATEADSDARDLEVAVLDGWSLSTS